MDEHGDTVSYTPTGGAAGDITAVLSPFFRDEADGEDGLEQPEKRQITVQISEVATPLIHDKVTINAVDWDVSAILEQDENLARLELTKGVTQEHSGPGYRRSAPRTSRGTR